eukprot:UN00704
MHSDKSRVKISQNHISNLDKVFLRLSLSSDFGLEARILLDRLILSAKMKKSKNQHTKT